MYFEELTLHNFGIYRGRHTLNLSVEPGKPIILIGALNGGGKTTILDALQLALHGKFARCSNRGTLGYEAFLKKAINRYSDPQEGAAVELEFTRYADNKPEKIRLIRTWRQTGEVIKEQFEVVRDGKLDPVYSENWYEHVDEFIPTRLAELFFFDGEKIEYFADPDNASELIRSGLDSLLGLDTVNQLIKDLDVVAQKRIKKAGNDNLSADLDALKTKLTDLESHRSELTMRRAEHRKDLDLADKEINKLTAHFQSIGGDLYERQAELEAEKQAADEAVDAASAALRELAAGGLPLLLLEDQVKEAQAQALAEDGQSKSAAALEILEARDAELLSHLESMNTDKTVLTAIEKFIQSDTKRRKSAIQHDKAIGVPYAEIAKYDDDYFDQLRKAAKEALEAHEAATERQARATRTLAGIPHTEEVNDVSNRLAAEKATRENLLQQISLIDAQLLQIQKDVDDTEARISGLMSDKVLTDFADETAQRILDQRETAQKVLKQFNERLRARHIHQLETLLLESLRALYRKERLVTKVSINSDSLELVLQDSEGNKLTPDRLSAGERQLLAVALVWSIARASTTALPTVIDTPLGRLDSNHRRTLVENYFPRASHQALLLSTDEEINGDLYTTLVPSVSRCATVTYDETINSSQFTADYFDKERL